MTITSDPPHAASHTPSPWTHAGGGAPRAHPGAARLLSAPADRSFAAHLAHWGALDAPHDLLDELRRADLRGRGGAGFPTACKIAEVQKNSSGLRRRPVIVANGTESEPVSSKDRVLLSTNPHLVIDGMVAAARCVGASEGFVCVKDGRQGAALAAQLERAIAERAHVDRVELWVSRVPGTYVAGEESALVNWLNTDTPLPTLTPPRPAQRGVGRAPTLVDNVETLAHIGLIARFGASWWRTVSPAANLTTATADGSGTMLVTVTGGVQRPGVREVPVGAPLAAVLDDAGAVRPSGVLVGGYFGTWLSTEHAYGARLSHESMRQLGAGLGCGAIVVMPAEACPLSELARVAHWMAGQSAGQCGPCANGLPAIATALDDVVRTGSAGAADAARRWCDMVAGRGACKLPDGAISFVRSGLDVFADHVAQHRHRRPCPATDAVLPVPSRRTIPLGVRR